MPAGRQAFTLLEVLVALFVITVGVGGVFSLVTQTLSFAANAQSQLTATYLAQEGIEIVRNIRDSNFLRIHKGVTSAHWDDGLTGCESSSTGCEADYTSTSLLSQDRFLNIAQNFYSYLPGTQTAFKRKIFIDAPSPDVRNVTVQVSWQERGRTHQVSDATVLYNWLTPTK